MTDWYARRNELEPGQRFTTLEGDVVELDRGVPGDATRWYVFDVDSEGRTFAYDSTIEPGDLLTRVG